MTAKQETEMEDRFLARSKERAAEERNIEDSILKVETAQAKASGGPRNVQHAFPQARHSFVPATSCGGRKTRPSWPKNTSLKALLGTLFKHETNSGSSAGVKDGVCGASVVDRDGKVAGFFKWADSSGLYAFNISFKRTDRVWLVCCLMFSTKAKSDYRPEIGKTWQMFGDEASAEYLQNTNSMEEYEVSNAGTRPWRIMSGSE